MCDTLGVVTKECSWFAKNSDRSPNEPQVLEFHPARQGLGGMVRVTYIEVPQAESTYAVLLSRPTWMWGAEMGVNEHGVCIGNEAVFTKGSYGKESLIGMDMVRLALERSASAAEAVACIQSLLAEYGQGGNCGFDHDFRYDNAFLIQDRQELYVLETAGKEWVVKKYRRASISNRLSIGPEGDDYSRGYPYDFRKKHTEPVFTFFSGSKQRRSQTGGCLKEIASVEDCMKALRVHDRGVKEPLAQGSVSSACMHYGGMVGDHTTSSMIVALEPERILVWATGSSTPCISLFKPWVFGNKPMAPIFAAEDSDAKSYWMERELFHRSLLGKRLPDAYYQERDALEQRWLSLSAASYGQCAAEETAFYEKWKNYAFEKTMTSKAFVKRWEKKNEALK